MTEHTKPVQEAADNARPGPGSGEQSRRRTLPKAATFWILAALFLMLFFSSAAASPLYRLYQAQFQFSAATLTAVFAVYVLVLLVTLLFFGSVSDYLGRPPVIIIALAFSAAGCAVFLTAHAAAAFALRGISSRAAMLAGCLFLLAGVAVTFGAIATTTSAAFLAGTAVAGAGFGLAFLGAFRMTTALAAPDQRAGLLAAIFLVSYLAFSVPALIAGVATTRFGLQSTALAYSASLAALAAATVSTLLFRPGDRPTRPAPASHAVMPPGPCTAPPCLQALEPSRRQPGNGDRARRLGGSVEVLGVFGTNSPLTVSSDLSG